MNENLLGAAYNLLKKHSKEEIEELVATLQKYNRCDPEHRSDCLKYGCKTATEANQQIITNAIERYLAKSAQDIYMGPTSSRCSCCGKSL
jgi:hypothetical protein